MAIPQRFYPDVSYVPQKSFADRGRSLDQTINSYLKAIPKNTAIAAITAFTVGFVIETVFSGNPVVGLATGAYSAIATVIHGLVTPLFKQAIGQDRLLTWSEEMLRGCISFIATGCIALAMGTPAVLNVLTVSAVFYGLKIIIRGDSWRSLNNANYLVMFPSTENLNWDPSFN